MCISFIWCILWYYNCYGFIVRKDGIKFSIVYVLVLNLGKGLRCFVILKKENYYYEDIGF